MAYSKDNKPWWPKRPWLESRGNASKSATGRQSSGTAGKPDGASTSERDTSAHSPMENLSASSMTSLQLPPQGSPSSSKPLPIVQMLGDRMEHSRSEMTTLFPPQSRAKVESPGRDYRSGKSIAMDIGMASIAARGGLDMDYIGDYLKRTHGGLKNLTKHDYEKLAAAVQGIDAALRQMMLMGRPDAAEISEMIAARIGLALAQENKEFDSWKWAAACKGEST